MWESPRRRPEMAVRGSTADRHRDPRPLLPKAFYFRFHRSEHRDHRVATFALATFAAVFGASLQSSRCGHSNRRCIHLRHHLHLCIRPLPSSLPALAPAMAPRCTAPWVPPVLPRTHGFMPTLRARRPTHSGPYTVVAGQSSTPTPAVSTRALSPSPTLPRAIPRSWHHMPDTPGWRHLIWHHHPPKRPFVSAPAALCFSNF